MTARERLDQYLAQLGRRLRLAVYARGFAVAAAAVLLITCVTVLLLERQNFAPSVAISGRTLLVLVLIAVAVTLLWMPLRRFRRDNGAGVFEERLPGQHGRIATYLDIRRRESAGQVAPLAELLAEDANQIAESTPPEAIVTDRRIGITSVVAGGGVLALAALLAFGPGLWGYGTRYLLLGADLPREAVPVRSIAVKPGDATVRRNSDMAIRATVEGFTPTEAAVFVRFADQQQWERAPMQPASETTGHRAEFQFHLYAVRAPLEYYVEADGTRSTQHKVAVVDLPRIEKVRLTYNYPDWTGLTPATEEELRSIRAVAGTKVKVEVFANAPLEAPALIVDGQTGELSTEGQASVGQIEVEKTGHYQIGAKVANEFVALTDEYPIEIVNDEKPSIEIQRPGRDTYATSIEEVPVRVQAQDDFRLQNVELRYSVNGGEWQKTSLAGGVKETDNASLLRLEELGAKQAVNAANGKQLVPGDLVSYYAVAKDRKETVQTDLYMVQVQPFERRFREGQGGGGGRGMSDEQGAISERQREILLATWNLQRNDERNARTREQLEQNAQMLAELQATLAQQARTLAERTRARSNPDEDERVKTFIEALERAAAVMDPAVEHLSKFRLADAVPVEQQALQQLLRAESAFRDVQVSMQRDSQGGGAQAARNFAEMFELEMDLEKSQYETESQMSTETAQQDLDETIRKLKELAERQEKLAQEANRQQMRVEEQRWRQEQLRREAEDLKRRLAELARQQQQRGQQQQGGQQQRGQQQQSAQNGGEPSDQQEPGSQGSQSGQSSSDRAREQERKKLQDALNSVNRALEQMRQANNATPGSEEEQARSREEASRNLRRALEQMAQPKSDGLGEALEQFAKRADELVKDQRRIESDLYNALEEANQSSRLATRGAIDPKRAESLVEDKQQMANELTELEQDIRNEIQNHRKDTPRTAQRAGEVVNELESSRVVQWVNRSAAEIYYGRAREAATREGLIAEGLENLEKGLREASTQGVREAKNGEDKVEPEQLLAEVAELRRALEQAQREAGEKGRNGEPRNGQRQNQNGEQQNGEQENGQQQNGQQQQNAQNDSQGQSRGQSQSQSSNPSGSPSSSPSQSQSASNQTGGGGPNIQSGLRAWDPTAIRGRLSDSYDRRGSLAPQTAEIGERLRNLVNRMDSRELTQAELDLLRRATNQLRRLSGDPMASHYEALKLIDQIELTALSAAARAKDGGSAHTATPTADSPRYRETVAEYWRRLGGS
jgi:hypothetical protein